MVREFSSSMPVTRYAVLLSLLFFFLRSIWLRTYNFCFCLPFSCMAGNNIFRSCPVRMGVSMTAFFGFSWDFVNDTQILTPRLKTPMIRRQRGGKLEPVSWDEALNYVAERLSAIKEKYGPDAIQTTGSSRGTGNETNYVMQKFARAVIGTNNVDCCARV